MEDTASTPQPAPQSHHGWTAAILLFLFTIAVVWAVNVGLRLSELPAWQECVYCQVEGQWLMATHDAYFWLSGAEEVGRAADRPMPRLVRFIHNVTGVDFPTLGFWLPVLLAPLAVIPLCLLAFRWNMPEAALPFGILAAGCFGYLQRTRLGYLDDDPLTLFFPVALGVALVFWLTPQISSSLRTAWLSFRDKAADPAMPNTFVLWLGALGVGLLFRAYMWTYGTAFPVAMSMTLIAVGVGLLLARPGMRPAVLVGSVILLATALGGWPGLLLSAALLVVSGIRPAFSASWICAGIALLAFLVILALGGQYQNLVWRMIQSILVYAKLTDPMPGVAGATGILFPSAVESIREAQTPSLSVVVGHMAGHWAVFIPAVLGYCWLVWKRPAALVFLPLLGLGLAATQLGNRFTMYGGVPLGLGLGFALVAVLDLLKVRTALIRWFLVLGLALLAIYPVHIVTLKLRPQPVTSPPLAEAFLEMRKTTEPDARIWVWWDYGYAAHYYAQRHTFGDGGRQHGSWLYPLALVHATDSPLQARQIMLLMAESFASQESVARQRLKEREQEPPRYLLDRFSGDPGLHFAGLTPALADEFIAFFRDKELGWPKSLPSQYLVLAWDNIPLVSWITAFGTQELETGVRDPGHLIRLPPGLEIKDDGLLELPKLTLPLNTVTLIHRGVVTLLEWDHGETETREAHVLYFKDIEQAYLMDNKMRQSMMVRLLLDDPATVEDHFELVHENYPWVRVYRAVNR